MTIPTLSSVLADPPAFALSQSEYGGPFVPQSIRAILFSLIGGRLTQRHGLNRMLLVGLAADAVSMGFLTSTVLVAPKTAPIYPRRANDRARRRRRNHQHHLGSRRLADAR